MNIYIMRHGEASYSAVSDSSRPLTAFGEQQCIEVANWFNQQKITFSHGLVSPYLRAQQTYRIIADTVTVNQTKNSLLLTPGGNEREVAEYLTMLQLKGAESVLIVSHLPLVGYLVNELCPSVSTPMFSTAEVACISLSEDNQGELAWFHPPR